MDDHLSLSVGPSVATLARSGLCVAVALVLSACGRFGFDRVATDGAPVAHDDAPVDPMTDARTLRAMTLVRLPPLPSGTLDLGVTATPTGFTLTFTTASGSDMYGVNLAPSMMPEANWRPTSQSNVYIGTTLTWTGSLMTTMTTNNNQTYIKRYTSDLSSYTQMDQQNGLGPKP